MKKVSVIIPIYNVEQYLTKCLESVINQTYKNLEIICVNDCSSDNSYTILEEYFQKDNRIKIIYREKNGGLSAARNSGLDVATGEYIYFIDSDDWIGLDYIDGMVKAIEKANTDIVLNTNIQSVDKNIITPFKWYRYSKKLTEGEYLNTENAVNKSHVMIWTHLYKRSFLDKYNLKFPEGYIHEDEYFQHISKIRCDKIFCFYGSSYYYRQHPQSIMAMRKNRVLPNVKIINLLFDFYEQNEFLKQNNIYLYIIDTLSEVSNAEEFEFANKTAKRIVDEKSRFYFSDFERFKLKLLADSTSFNEFKQKCCKNIRIAYMRKTLMQKPKVSVIIPIYNVEQYLRKCLDSVCNQTLEDIEIICINDCSPDNSLEILKEYQKNDNRIKIIDFNENKGSAVARNTGMEQAKGEYIGFIDPDDWIDLDFYEKLYNKAKDCSSDLVIGNIKTVLNKKEIKNNNDFQIFSKERVFYGLFQLGLYKRDLLSKYSIKFLEGCMIGEDRLLPIKACYYTRNFQIVEDVFYNQLTRDNSATKNINERKILDFIRSTKLVIEFLNSVQMNERKKTVIVNSFWTNLLCYINTANSSYINHLCDLILYFGGLQNIQFLNQFDFELIQKIKVMDFVTIKKVVQKSMQKRAVDMVRSLNINKKGR